MGYSHYWEHVPHPSAPGWKYVVAVAALAATEVPLWREFNSSDSPVYAHGEITFNGAGADGHETFSLGIPSNSCKTNQKPYDVAVTAVLLAARHYFLEPFTVHTDGDDESWEPARALLRRHGFPFGDEYTVHPDGRLVRKVAVPA